MNIDIAPDCEHESDIVFVGFVVDGGEVEFDSLVMGLCFDLLGEGLECVADCAGGKDTVNS